MGRLLLITKKAPICIDAFNNLTRLRNKCTRKRSWTVTPLAENRILSPACLPIPPSGYPQNKKSKLQAIWKCCTGAKDRARTGHPDLGKVVLYQMSYFRMFSKNFIPLKEPLFFRWDCKDRDCFQKTKLFWIFILNPPQQFILFTITIFFIRQPHHSVTILPDRIIRRLSVNGSHLW